MSNRDTSIARHFHDATKLAYINLANKPPLYKTYYGLPAIPLPADFPSPPVPALDAVSAVAPAAGPELDLTALAQLLYFTAGVIRKGVFRTAGEVHFRAAASAGGLYPVETYLVSQGMPGLDAGVYHFAPENFSLTRLRQGDCRAVLAEAAGSDSTIAAAPLTIVFTIVFWRSSWKYRERGYRYCFWDNGTVAANLLATAAAIGRPARVVNAFIDRLVDELLELDGTGEASACLVSVGSGQEPSKAPPPGHLAPVEGASRITAPGEIDYPEIRSAHAATRLTSQDEVLACRGKPAVPPTAPADYPVSILPCSRNFPVSAPLGQTIRERGSTRRFARAPIGLEALAAILYCATRGAAADFLPRPGDSLLDLYLIANAVENLPAGAYYYAPQEPALHRLKTGQFREEAGHLGFEQALPADASAVVFLLSDLERILEQYGNRGYRAAQLEAGIIGGKLYLGAHSLGLGASGLTFYDDEVTGFFSPHAAGKSAMFVAPLGVTDAVNRVRPFRSRIGMLLDAQSRGARPRE